MENNKVYDFVERLVARRKITNEDTIQELYLTAAELIAAGKTEYYQFYSAITKKAEELISAKEEHKELITEEMFLVNIDKFINNRLLHDDLMKALSTLTEIEQTVIRLRFRDGLHLDQAGYIMGLTRERIRQIEAKAIRKLRNPCRSNGLRVYLID